MAVSHHIPSRYSPQDAPPPAGQSAVPAVYFEQGHINPWRMSSQRLFILVVFTAGNFYKTDFFCSNKASEGAPTQSRGLAAGRREKNWFPFFPLPALFKTRPCSLIQTFSAEHLIRLQTVTQTFMATHASAAHHTLFIFSTLGSFAPKWSTTSGTQTAPRTQHKSTGRTTLTGNRSDSMKS